MSERIIHLMRHGPPARTGLLLGHADEPATTDDCPRMLALARSLPLTRIVASDLSRAAHQAATLARRLDLPITHDPRWRELHFGAWDGLAPEALDRQALQRFWDDPECHAPPGGERWSCLRARVVAAINALASHTLVVTHAGAMRAAVSVLTGLDHRGVWAFDLPYRTMLTLRIWPDGSGQITALHGAEA